MKKNTVLNKNTLTLTKLSKNSILNVPVLEESN